MSSDEPEFCKINVDFKEFKLNNASFHFMTRAEPESLLVWVLIYSDE